MPSDKLKNHLHLHLIVFIWGFTAILGALISLNALPLVWYRMLFAVGFIYLYIRLKKISLRVTISEFLLFILAGLIIALHWFTFFRAIKISNISITLACLSTGSLFVSFLEPIFYKKKVVGYEVLFGVLVFVGLYFIFRIETHYFLGIITALISAFLSALFAVMNSKLVKKHSPVTISFYELCGGTLFFTIFMFVFNSLETDVFVLTTSDFIYLLILSSVCTAYAFIASTSVMKVLSPYTVMITTNLEPIYGIILAVLLFDEDKKMTSEFFIGAIIILVTIFINAYLKLRRK